MSRRGDVFPCHNRARHVIADKVGTQDIVIFHSEGTLAALDEEELRELVIDAWRMCVPKKVAAARLGL